MSINNGSNVHRDYPKEVFINIRKLSAVSHDTGYTPYEDKRATLTPVVDSRGLKDPRGFDFTSAVTKTREVIERIPNENILNPSRKFTDSQNMQMESPHFKGSENPSLLVPSESHPQNAQHAKPVHDFTEEVKTATTAATTKAPFKALLTPLTLREGDNVASFKPTTEEPSELTPSNSMIKGLKDLDTSMNPTQANQNSYFSSHSANITPLQVRRGTHITTVKKRKDQSGQLTLLYHEGREVCLSKPAQASIRG